MRRLYLQKPLDAEALRIINAWQQRMDAPPESGDRLWAVVDGAVVGDAGARSLQLAYGEPVRAFDGSPLADYEELGILLWPVAAMSAHDGLAALGQAVDASPSLSIVRTLKPVDDLCRLLSWLACASTTDGMRLYLRISDDPDNG
jgi:hypothetical protein